MGGADTKLAHLLWLLHQDYDITVVPNVRVQLEQAHWRAWLRELGVKAAVLEDLPHKLSGWGLSLCNGAFWGEGVGVEAHRRGLKIAWSNEMMWHHPAEIAAVRLGLVEAVLYTSEVQRLKLEAGFAGVERKNELSVEAQGRLPGAVSLNSQLKPHSTSFSSGTLENGTRWAITGNYIAPELFPWKDRTKGRRFGEFVIGRLSRPDPAKFPRDFPESYQRLRLKNPRYRVMAWSEEMGRQYKAGEKKSGGVRGKGSEGASPLPPHSPTPPQSRFVGPWDLLPALAEPTVEFLHSLDLFAYDLREDCCESWGRAVVEAMLTGAIPLVPAHPRHHLKNLVPQGVGGFLCSTKAEWREHAQRLQADGVLRQKMSRAAREFAAEELCHAAEHRAAWRAVFEN